MLRIFFFIIFVSAVILLFGLIQLLLLRQLNRVWWKQKWIRRGAYSLPITGVVSLVLLGLAEYHRIGWLAALASPVTVLAVILEIALMLSLPVSGAFHLVEGWLGRLSRRRRIAHADDVPDQRRRVLLKGAAALVPVATVGAALGGVGRAYAGAEVKRISFDFRSLPHEFEGMRILQLSDVHLRHYVTLDNLEEILDEAVRLSPDLVLVTGDLSDDLEQLPPALDMIAALNPRLGSYAILGNHEYFRGIQQVRSIYSRSPVRLLVNEHVLLTNGGSPLLLAGIDDPIALSRFQEDFYTRSIETTLADAPEEVFSLLMSHRPDAFRHAAARGVDLTLAGHTHGGQVGFGGRFILESSYPHSYLWGKYTINDSQFYTTSGAGHWFPFRLGCPAEAPVIELHGQ